MQHPRVDPVAVADGIFKDWADALEELYIKAPTGETDINHNFDINVNKGNSMVMTESCKDMVMKTIVLVKRDHLNQEATFWKALEPELIPPVGIQDIKWNTLYKQWGPYVPQDKRKEWRYYHEEPLNVEEVKEHTKARKQRAARSRTIIDKDGNKVAAKPPTKKPPKKAEAPQRQRLHQRQRLLHLCTRGSC
jgi:hypothetical protein